MMRSGLGNELVRYNQGWNGDNSLSSVAVVVAYKNLCNRPTAWCLVAVVLVVLKGEEIGCSVVFLYFARIRLLISPTCCDKLKVKSHDKTFIMYPTSL
jgi:hypothetical protein